MADEAKKYVIVGTRVDNWGQGEVIERDALFIRGEDGQVIKDKHSGKDVDRLERLVKIGAIRPASDAEMNLAVVPVASVGINSTQAAALQTLDATIAKLTDDVAAHEARATSHAALRGALPPAKVEEDPAFKVAIEERQERVKALEQRLEAATKKAEEHVKALAEKAEAAAKEAPDTGGLAVTGQAIPSGAAPSKPPAHAPAPRHRPQ